MKTVGVDHLFVEINTKRTDNNTFVKNVTRKKQIENNLQKKRKTYRYPLNILNGTKTN